LRTARMRRGSPVSKFRGIDACVSLPRIDTNNVGNRRHLITQTVTTRVRDPALYPFPEAKTLHGERDPEASTVRFDVARVASGAGHLRSPFAGRGAAGGRPSPAGSATGLPSPRAA